MGEREIAYSEAYRFILFFLRNMSIEIWRVIFPKFILHLLSNKVQKSIDLIFQIRVA